MNQFKLRARAKKEVWSREVLMVIHLPIMPIITTKMDKIVTMSNYLSNSAKLARNFFCSGASFRSGAAWGFEFLGSHPMLGF